MKILLSPPPKTSFTFRVETELHDAFMKIAQANDRTAALLLRDFMREYVRKHGQGDLLKG